MRDGRERKGGGRLDEDVAAVYDVGSYRAAGVDSAAWAIDVDEAQGDATNPMRETSEGERQTTVCVSAQRVDGLASSCANEELDWHVH
jgi:hypothetical protein